jgi:hypothetical protein
MVQCKPSVRYRALEVIGPGCCHQWCNISRVSGIEQESNLGTCRDQCSYLLHEKVLLSLEHNV